MTKAKKIDELSDDFKQTIKEILEQPVEIIDGVACIFEKFKIYKEKTGHVQLKQHFRRYGWYASYANIHWLDITVNQLSDNNYQKNTLREILGTAVYLALLKYMEVPDSFKVKPLNRKVVVQTIDALNGCFDELVVQCTEKVIKVIRSYYTDNRIKLFSNYTLLGATRAFQNCENWLLIEKLMDRTPTETLPPDVINYFVERQKDNSEYTSEDYNRIYSIKRSPKIRSFRDLILNNIKFELNRSSRTPERKLSAKMADSIYHSAIFILSYLETQSLNDDSKKYKLACVYLVEAMNCRVYGLSLILIEFALKNPDCNFEGLQSFLKFISAQSNYYLNRRKRILECLVKNCIVDINCSTVKNFFNEIAKYQHTPNGIRTLLYLVSPTYDSMSWFYYEISERTDSKSYLDMWFAIDPATGLSKLDVNTTSRSLNEVCVDFLLQWSVEFKDYGDPVIQVKMDKYDDNDDLVTDAFIFKDVTSSPNGIAWAACLNGFLLPKYLMADKRFANWVPKVSYSCSALFNADQNISVRNLRNRTSAIFLKMNGCEVERVMVIHSTVDVAVNKTLKLKAVDYHASIPDFCSKRLCEHLNEIGYFDHLWELPLGTVQV